MMIFFQTSLPRRHANKSNVEHDSILVYIGGQSNGQGVASGSPISPYDSAIDGAVIWTGSKFDTLEYNVNNDANSTKKFGCELSLGYKLNELFGDTIFLVKYAVSATAINELSGESDFNPNSDEYYPIMTSKVQAAYDYMVNDLGKNPLILCLWLQGERDARAAISSDLYDVNFSLLKKSFASDIFDSKWWLNTLGSLQRDAFSSPDTTWDIVRSKQQSLISENSDIFNIDLDDKTLNDDGLHYDATSQIEIGNQIAQSMYDEIKSLIN